MSSAPYMQLYIADYLGDTQHLTTEQHGAYLLLLMAMWRAGGRLPNDAGKLARIARVSLRRWHLVAGDVMPFFDVEGDDITQKRLEREHQKVLSISEKRSASGAAGGAAKALKNNDAGLASAKQLPKHRARVPEPDTIKNSISGSSNPRPIARKHPWPSDYREWFWRIYPKHVEKKPAMTALDKVHASDDVPWDAIIAGIEALISHVEQKYHPAAHRWLRDERWNDEHRPASRAPPRPGGRPTNADLANHFESRLRAKHNGQSPDDPTQERIAGTAHASRGGNGPSLFEPDRLAGERAGPILDLVATRSDRH